jgi:hypothetical protein
MPATLSSRFPYNVYFPIKSIAPIDTWHIAYSRHTGLWCSMKQVHNMLTELYEELVATVWTTGVPFLARGGILSLADSSEVKRLEREA